jgi:cytochrome c5
VRTRDSSFLKTTAAASFGFAVVSLALLSLTTGAAKASAPGAQASVPAGESVEDRIRPVGKVRIRGQAVEEEPVAAAPAVERTGKEVVDLACAACHATGAAGAPKIADKDAWAPRLGQGFETLVSHAIGGFKGMPARGGNPSLSDGEVQRAVAHLVEQVGMKVDLPPPAAAAPAAPPVAAPQAAPADAAPMAAAVADLGRGENIYKQVCSACHTMGVAGAPKLGDREAWAARLAQGQETLNQHSLQGIRGMPPKGGRVDLPDAVILDAVAYMLKESS